MRLPVCWYGLLALLILGAKSPCSLGQEAGRIALERLEALDALVERAIEEKKLPGCVIGVGNRSGLVWSKAYGKKRLEPDEEIMTRDTVFDMASITKPVVTATCILKLIEDGGLRLTDRVAEHLPEFGEQGKSELTVQHLLLHTSGLIPDNPLADYREGKEIAWKRICALPLVYPTGSEFRYSDVNYIVLGVLVERLSGQGLDAYASRVLLTPLKMLDSGFCIGPQLQSRSAPTEKRDQEWIQGVVHDPRSHAMGGVAGHAGLFSTVEDVARYARMMLGGGTLRESDGSHVRILAPATVALMTAPYAVPGGTRGLGWDIRTAYSSNRGDKLSPSAFGHGGFTGTVLWIDPDMDLFFVFLSNRLHPSGDGSVNSLAGRILNVVASAVAP